jgi:hypothetical protein
VGFFDPSPKWVRTSKKQWEEDDAYPPDSERIGGAWRRLFGVPPPDNKAALAEYDGGDEFWWLHEGGRIVVLSYAGGAIYTAKETT